MINRSSRARRLERDRFIRMVFRQMPGAVWTTDRNLCLTYVAGRLAKDVGLRARTGMTVFDVVGSHAPSNPVIARHRAALSGESQCFEYLFFGRWYAIFIEQLLADHDVVAGCIASAFDITEQRTIKERLSRSESFLAQAQR